MPAPANYGFPGTINAAALARWVPAVGAAQYGALDEASCKPTVMLNLDRGVSIAPGTIWGDGVMTDFFDLTTIALPAPVSGSVWHLIVARRDWSLGGTTTFTSIPGSATMELPAFENEPGIISDQPIALARVTAGSATVQELIDLRCWAGNGGVFAKSDLVRSYLTRIGTEVTINGSVWSLQVVNNTGQWVRVAEVGRIPLFATGTPLAGVLSAGLNFLVQPGSFVGKSDPNGFGRLTFPVAFPNGLLTVVMFNGDGWASGPGVTFAAAGSATANGTPNFWGASGFGTKTDIVYEVRDANGAMAPNRSHRLNYIAIGW